MPKILVYRSNLLPISEVFIKEQMLAYRRWHGVLVGMRRLSIGLNLDNLDLFQLRSNTPGAFNRICWQFSQKFGTLPPYVLKRLRGASLVHAHFGPDAIEAWPLACAFDLPMLVTLHGYDINIYREWWETKHQGEVMANYPSRLLGLAQNERIGFIAVSNAIYERAISFGIPKNKIFVKYIGVNLARFVPSGRPVVERQRRVLFVGRLVDKKGCEYLIKAISKVKNIVPDVMLSVVGDGPLRGRLQQLAEDLGVRAEFHGSGSTDDVKAELDIARVFCLPSVTELSGDSEGFGIVLLEAQAAGVPVITSARGGSTEGIIEGATGFSFAERDVDGLAAKLNLLLTDDKIVTSMAICAQRFVAEKFDIHKCTEELELLYDSFTHATSLQSAATDV